jgi:hypothetical protein
MVYPPRRLRVDGFNWLAVFSVVRKSERFAGRKGQEFCAFSKYFALDRCNHKGPKCIRTEQSNCFYGHRNCFRPKLICIRSKSICFFGHRICFRPKLICIRSKSICFFDHRICFRPKLICIRSKSICFFGHSVCFRGKINCFRPNSIYVYAKSKWPRRHPLTS